MNWYMTLWEADMIRCFSIRFVPLPLVLSFLCFLLAIDNIFSLTALRCYSGSGDGSFVTQVDEHGFDRCITVLFDAIAAAISCHARGGADRHPRSTPFRSRRRANLEDTAARGSAHECGARGDADADETGGERIGKLYPAARRAEVFRAIWGGVHNPGLAPPGPSCLHGDHLRRAARARAELGR